VKMPRPLEYLSLPVKRLNFPPHESYGVSVRPRRIRAKMFLPIQSRWYQEQRSLHTFEVSS
jgi:hypothetical protein